MKTLIIFLSLVLFITSCTKSTSDIASKQKSEDELRLQARRQAQADAPYHKCQQFSLVSTTDKYAVTDFNWSDSVKAAFRVEYFVFNQDSIITEVKTMTIAKNDVLTNNYIQICYPSLIP